MITLPLGLAASAHRLRATTSPAGFIQNFRTGAKVNWKASGPAAPLDAQDRARLAAEAAQKRHDRAREREQQYERAAQQADALWAAAAPVETHPYPQAGRAGAGRHGDRPGGQAARAQPRRPAPGAGGRRRRLIAEGYATAATVHELTGAPVVVAFNAGNLLPVARTYRALHPERPIHIAGDDDHRRAAEGKPNVGREKAEQAAAAIGGQALFPEFPAGSNGTDWNDLAQDHGRETARVGLKAAFAIAERELMAQGFAVAREQAGYGGDRSVSAAPAPALGRERTPEMEVER